MIYRCLFPLPITGHLLFHYNRYKIKSNPKPAIRPDNSTGYKQKRNFMKIGILSDTHGVLKDTFLDELQSCDYLLHAGDIGSLKCYETLKICMFRFISSRGTVTKANGRNICRRLWQHPLVGRFSISSIRKAICLIHNRKQILLLPGIPTIMK